MQMIVIMRFPLDSVWQELVQIRAGSPLQIGCVDIG